MSVLVDIGHAHDIHFFKNSIRELKKFGVEVLVSAKNKPHVLDIANYEKIPVLPEYRVRSYKERLFKLPNRALRLKKLIGKHKIRLVIGIDLVDGSIGAKLARVPSISVSANPHHTLANTLVWIFSGLIITPRSSPLRFPSKQNFFPGFGAMAYLHPRIFKPSKSNIESLLENGPPIIIRFINWESFHDIGVKKRNLEYYFAEKLRRDYPVYVSGEGKVPREFQDMVLPFNDSRLHDLLAYSRLYIGPGASTALEAAYLGTPALYTNPLVTGPIDLVQKSYDLIYCANRINMKTGLDWALETSLDEFRKRARSLQEDSLDLTMYIVKLVLKNVK